jgi:hypothetical protein
MPKAKAASSGAVKKPRKTGAQPTHEQIALRAYHIFLERGSTPGDPMEDWLRAERELMESSKNSRRKPKVVSIAA